MVVRVARAGGGQKLCRILRSLRVILHVVTALPSPHELRLIATETGTFWLRIAL